MPVLDINVAEDEVDSVLIRTGDDEVVFQVDTVNKKVIIDTLQATVSSDRITSDTTLTANHETVFVDTDLSDVAITLPPLINGERYKIINSGTSENDATIIPDDTDLLFGENVSFDLYDGEVIEIDGNLTEGWW